MNYLYFDTNRAIKARNFEKLYAGSQNVDYLYVFADFDASIPSAYTVTARFIRADGFVIGELPLTAITEASPLTGNDMRAHRLLLDGEVLKIPGSLSVTISFNKTLDDVPIVMTTGMATATVYTTVPINTRENAQIQAIMRMVQSIAGTVDRLDPSTQEVKVTFVWGDGSVSTINIEHLTSVDEPPSIIREGYTFVGWYSDAALTTAYDFATLLSNDIILFAKWKVTATDEPELPPVPANNIRITYIANGGTVITPKTLPSGSNFIEEVSSKAGYELEGWYSEDFAKRYTSTDIITSDIIVYAKWSYSDTVKVTFMVDSEIYAKVRVEKGDKMYYSNRPEDPFKIGKSFRGWFTSPVGENEYSPKIDFSIKTFDIDTILYAGFITKLCMATIYWPNQNPEEIYGLAMGTKFSALGLVDPLPDSGFEFDGWYAPNKLFRYYSDYSIDDDIEVYPEFYKVNVTSSTKTVTFNSNGGTPVESQSIAYGGLITVPTPPTKENNTFVGWYRDSSLTSAWDFSTDKVGSHDMTLYAKWIATTTEQYTVRFIANGEVLKSVTKTKGASLSSSDLPSNPTKEGYLFAWWYYRSNNSKRFALTDSFTTGTVDIVARCQSSETTTVEVSCEVCDGIGIFTGLVECDNCHGDERVVCGVCGGTGYVNNANGHGCSSDAEDAVECSTCNGYGLVDCPECEGAGHQYKEGVTCTRCGGTGTITETNISYNYTFDTL